MVPLIIFYIYISDIVVLNSVTKKRCICPYNHICLPGTVVETVGLFNSKLGLDINRTINWLCAVCLKVPSIRCQIRKDGGKTLTLYLHWLFLETNLFHHQHHFLYFCHLALIVPIYLVFQETLPSLSIWKIYHPQCWACIFWAGVSH